MKSATAFTAVLALNLLWFGIAFVYFSFTPNTAAKLIIPRATYESPLLPTFAASLRFLGGMNFAFAVFAGILLLYSPLFPEPAQRALFAGVFSLAHVSQVVSNLPGALRRERTNEPMWPVRSGPMLFIFLVDIALTVANAAIATVLLYL